MNTKTKASAHTEPVKSTFYSACRACVLGSCLLMGATNAHATLLADGRLSDGEGYTSFYWVTYPDADHTGNEAGWVGAAESSPGAGDGVGVGSGLLALGTDPATGNHFMYYALPKGYVDNTYREGAGAETPPIVGIYEGSSGHQLGTGLIGSDNFGNTPFELYFTNNTINPDGPLEHFRFTVDYLADVYQETSGTNPRVDIQSGGINGVNDDLPTGFTYSRNDGSLGNTDNHQDLFIKIATSMEWNIDHYGPTGTGDITADNIANLSGYLANSPDVVRQVGGIDDGLAILAADGYSYQPADPTFADWIYEVAYEFEFDASLFGAEWTDGSLAVEDLLKLPTPHASPNKGLGSYSGDPGDPVFEQVVVPVPAAVWLFASGLLGLVGIARRRKTA
jgi:hypothetical protein